MKACEDCWGAGGREIAIKGRTPPWGDGADDGYWQECAACHGSGWIAGDPPQLEMDEAYVADADLANPSHLAIDDAEKTVMRVIGLRARLSSWECAPGRTHAEILDALDRAIAQAEAGNG